MGLRKFSVQLKIFFGKDKFKMQVGKTKYLITPKRKDHGLLSPKSSPLHSSESVSQFHSLNNKGPLNNNQNDLSFKGSFLYKEANKGNQYLKKELLDFLRKNLGHMGEDLYNHVATSQIPLAKKMFHINAETEQIVFHKKSIPHLIGDGLVLRNLPSDILNGTVDLIGKIKPFSAWAERTHNSPFMKRLRAESKIEAQISSLRGLAETRAKLLKEGKNAEEIQSAMFQQKMKMFDPKTGNYDTKHERSLNRIVSGFPPAIFLANDAYNLSRMMDDDKDKAEHEKKLRFRQEASRIGINAYITLITFGALQKLMNNSNLGIMLTTGLTALFTESFSRLSNGKHIKRLTPEEARAENLKNNAPEKNIKPDNSFKAHPQTDNKKQQKPLLSIDTVGKASLGVIAAGFAIKGMRKFKPVDNAINAAFKPFKNLYNKLTTIPDYRIDGEKFEKIVQVLKDNGFTVAEDIAENTAKKPNFIKRGWTKFVNIFKKQPEKVENEVVIKATDLADDYLRVADFARNADGTISLGTRDKKIKPFVNFVIAPFKFAWSTVTLPYRLVDKGIKSFTKQPKLAKLAISDKQTLKTIAQNMQKELKLNESFVNNIENFVSALKKKAPAELTETEKVFMRRVGDVEALAKSLDNIGKQALKENFDPKKFHDYVCDNLLKAFNADTMSNVSNAELSNLAKTAATAATLWFLMTDNYNMVMLKSNGNDVEGAQTKFKERFVQEGSRLFYQTLLIDLFNSTFRSQYNKSLFGMTWITLTNTTLGEWLTRKSVGVAVGAHTREELLKMEEKQDNAKGFLKGYYNFMQRLTGKRSIKSYDINTKEQSAVSNVQPNKEVGFGQQSNLVNMIKK